MDDEFYRELLSWSAAFSRRSLEDFHRFTRDAGLTMLQMHLLMYLHSHGPCEMTALVDATLTSKAAVSQMVDRLVQQQFVERAEAPTDRRAKLVSLTRKGEHVVEQSTSVRQDWLERAGAMLTAQQKLQIARALRTLADAAARAESKADSQSEGKVHTSRRKATRGHKNRSEE